MNVLVIGGTRFIGPPVLRRLLEAGNEVTLFYRGRTTTGVPQGASTILGDRRPLAPYADRLRATCPDVVLDMIALTESDAREVMETFRGIAKRVVTISSMDVYLAFGKLRGTEAGEPESEPITEDSPLRTNWYPYREGSPRADDDPRKILDDYDKIPIERIVLGDPEMPGTILRLPMVYGPGDYQHRLYDYVKRMADGRKHILIQDTFASWRTTRGYVEDIGEGIFRAVTDELAAGEVFNIAEDVFHRERDWIELIGSAMGWRGDVLELPASSLPESLRSPFDARHHLMVDSSKIRRILGWKPETDPIAAIKATAEYELANPPESFDADYHAEDKAIDSARMAT